MCDWGGNGKLFFPLIPHPSSCSLPPSLTHTHRHSHTSHLLATITTTITTGTQQKAMMQLTSCASPAILGVTANISQDGSSVQALTPAGYPAGSLSPSWHRPSTHIGSADGIRGSRAKKGWKRERGGPFFLFSSNGGSFQESHSFQYYSEACNTSRKIETRGVKYEKCFTHFKVSL